jgi:hypothetical protein
MPDLFESGDNCRAERKLVSKCICGKRDPYLLTNNNNTPTPSWRTNNKTNRTNQKPPRPKTDSVCPTKQTSTRIKRLVQTNVALARSGEDSRDTFFTAEHQAQLLAFHHNGYTAVNRQPAAGKAKRGQTLRLRCVNSDSLSLCHLRFAIFLPGVLVLNCPAIKDERICARIVVGVGSQCCHLFPTAACPPLSAVHISYKRVQCRVELANHR